MRGRSSIQGRGQRHGGPERLRTPDPARPTYPLGYAWQQRRAMGRKMHVVTHAGIGATGWVLLCTGKPATMEHRKGFLTGTNCSTCRVAALTTSINYPKEESR